MQKIKLTENELVLELDKLGFGTVSKRKIAEWRKEALLPDFDIIGCGRGKGQGRTESLWEHSELVIEQAKWIQRMRAGGILHKDFHLNLWILGYSIHPEDVRDSLLEPLEDNIKMLALEAEKLQRKWRLFERTDGIFEDVINDGATAAFTKMEQTPFEPLVMPQEVFETLANIFLNPGFIINLPDLDAAFNDLEGWSQVTQQFSSKLFDELGEEVKNDKNHLEAFVFLLQNAPFIQRHFSLYQVEKAIRECTHEDLAEVQTDLRILTKIVTVFARTIEAIKPHIKPMADSPSNTDAFLPMLFHFAEYFVLADISLRRSGYAYLINQTREKVLDKIEKEFSETVRQDLEQTIPVIGQSLSQTFEAVERKFSELLAESPKFRILNDN